MVGKRLVNTGGEADAAAFDPLQSFETVTYTGNGSTQKITGYIRKGAAFNGSSSYIESNVNVFSTTTYSVSLWVNVGGYKNASYNHWAFIINNDQHLVIGENPANTLKIYFSDFLTSNAFYTITDPTAWHHIVVTRNSNSVSVYVNGSLANTFTYTGLSQGTGFKLGTNHVNNAFLDGKLDQVRIFDKALSSSEVTTLYGETYASSTKSTTDILGDGSGVALYELDGDANDTGSNADTVDTADIFEDNSIIDFYQFNGNTQSTNNAPFYSLQTTSTTYGDGILGQSLYLNGSQTASLTANTYGTMNLTGSYSLSLYFNATTVNKRNMIWYLEQINGYSSAIELSSDNRLYFGNATITSQTYSANTWYNVVVSFDASNGLIKAYVNGQLLGSRTANTTTGSTQCFGHGGVGLTGYIDQARFFNRVITDSEAAELYEARVKYDGTPTNVNFLGMAFQPDLVWVKNRTSNWGHTLVDSVRGLNAASVYGALASDQTASETTDNVFGAIKSLDTNGFTTEGGSDVNGYYAVGRLNNDYVAWCWKAGGNSNTYNVDDTGYSTASDAGLSSANGTTLNGASVNTQAGFSIINYETNVNGDNRPAHGLTQEPELIIFKPYDTSSLNWYVMTKKIDGSLDFLFLNTRDAKTDSGTSEFINSTHFRTSFGTSWGSVIAYCFHSVDGYQKVGTYTSNASVKITTGFEPRWIMIKYTGGTNDWWIMDTSRYDGSTGSHGGKLVKPYLEANENLAEQSVANGSVEFVSDGFYPTNFFNSNGVLYLAIA
jgi:hypothetical protein